MLKHLRSRKVRLFLKKIGFLIVLSNLKESYRANKKRGQGKYRV
jgi:hypothetical protein